VVADMLGVIPFGLILTLVYRLVIRRFAGHPSRTRARRERRELADHVAGRGNILQRDSKHLEDPPKSLEYIAEPCRGRASA